MFPSSTATLGIERPPSAAVDAVCLHCGDPCGREAVTTGAGAFCCRGCASVFALLAEHGMAAFYTCDVRPGRSQREVGARDPERFAVLDDPDVAGRFLTPGHAGLAAVTFAVPGLHCASCLWLLEQLWRFDAGIARSEADLVRRTVRVEFRPERTSLRRVAAQLAALGYEPVIDSERTPGRPNQAARDLYLRIGVAGFAFGNVMIFSIPRYANGAPLDPSFQRLFDVLNVAFALPVLVYSARPYFAAAWTAVRARVMALEVPVALGLAVLFVRSVADIVLGRGEGFLDSFSGLVFFLLIGRLFQLKAFDAMAFDRTARSFLPLSVRVERGDGLELTPIQRLEPGDVIVIRTGEVVPADARLLEGRGAIDYAFVTGEQAPVAVEAGEPIAAGGRVTGRALRCLVVRPVSQSRLAELWSNPVFSKPKARWLLDVTRQFGWWFTAGAVGLAVVGALAWWPDAGKAADVATAVLIIACPCAITLSSPITLGTAMGALGRRGCYLKEAAVALDLSRIDTIAFDKTGTLTSVVTAAPAAPEGWTDVDWSRVRRLAAQSVHPMSRAIAGPLEERAPGGTCEDILDELGRGIAGTVDGLRVALGRASFVSEATGCALPGDDGRTWAAVGKAAPRVVRVFANERPGMDATLEALPASTERWLLSGDGPSEGPRWARHFGERMRFSQSAEAKLAAVRDRMATGRRVLMVGDGLNDAGALAAADVGLAVSDDTACIVPACDAVISGDRLTMLPAILRFARTARRIIVFCFAVSIAYNAVGLWLALAGRLTPLATAILMPVSSITVVGLSAGLTRRAARGLS